MGNPFTHAASWKAETWGCLKIDTMSKLKLESFPGDHRSLACQATAYIAGGNLVLTSAAAPGAAFITLDDGRSVSEWSAAAFYLAGTDTGVFGNSDRGRDQADGDRACVLEWLLRTERDLWPTLARATFGPLGLVQDYYADADDQKLKTEMGKWDSHLRTRTFLAADRLSAADVVAAATLCWSGRHRPGSSPTALGLPHLQRWLDTIVSQPGFQKALKEESRAAGIGFARVSFGCSHRTP